VPDYLVFLSDVTFRNNRGKLTVAATAVDGELASSVMTVSETENAVILGAVATHPDYRKRGLSREIARTVATRLRRQGKRVYVLSASEANTRFYQHSGFGIVAGFREVFYI
jgi:predicted GNAT family acetyltransferase